MEISYKLPMKSGWGLMNLSSSYSEPFAYKISQRLPARLSIISKSPNEFVNLSEADEYLKDIDNKLKDGKNVLDLLDELKQEEQKHD